MKLDNNQRVFIRSIRESMRELSINSEAQGVSGEASRIERVIETLESLIAQCEDKPPMSLCYHVARFGQNLDEIEDDTARNYFEQCVVALISTFGGKQ